MPKKAPAGPTKLRIERILEIHESTRKERGKNAQQWADEFEMSRRQVLRDLDFMKNRLGLPITYCKQRKAFIYLKDPGALPAMPTTEADLFAIAIAHKAVLQYEGTPFAGPLKNAFSKLLRGLDSEEEMTIEGWDEMLSIQPFATDQLDGDDFEILMRSIRQKLVVEIAYQGLKDASARVRLLQPYHLFYKLGAWYLLAFDHPHGDALKTFALHRMSDVTVVSGATFKPKKIDFQNHIANPFGVQGGTKPFNVIIEFSRNVARFISERKWHPSQQFESLPQGRLRLRMKVSDLEFVAAWVLGWAGDAKVIQPAKLGNLVVRKAKAVASAYGK